MANWQSQQPIQPHVLCLANRVAELLRNAGHDPDAVLRTLENGINEYSVASPAPVLGDEDLVSQKTTDGNGEQALEKKSAVGHAQVSMLQELYTMLAVVAPSGIGKTTLIAFTWLNGMVAPKVYNAQRKADLCPREELEATRLAYHACAEPGSGYSYDNVVHITKPAQFNTSDNPKLQTPMKTLTSALKQVEEYKLQKGNTFTAFKVFGPPGNRGSIGTPMQVAVAHGCEPLLLVQMVTHSQLSVPLADHVSSSDETKSDPRYCDHVARMYELMTETPDAAASGASSFAGQADSKPSGQRPLKKWIAAQAGTQLVLRSRSPDIDADLLTELLYISQIMHLLLPPALKGQNVLFKEEQLEMLTNLQQQNPTGPWGALIEAQAKSSTTNPTPIQQAREALLMCIQQITIFAPNELMARLKLVFLDTIGFDDKDPTRCVRQTKLEERLQHMLLLLPRDSSSMQGVTTHLQRSPFIQRLVIAHRDPSSPAAGPPPKLYAVVFPERNGWEPPDGHEEDGNTVNLPFMREHAQYLHEGLEPAVEKTRSDLEALFEEYLRSEAKAPGAEPSDAVSPKAIKEQAARIAGSVAVLHSFPMLGMAALKALMNGRAEELLPNEPDPRAALQRVIEGCSLAPFMDVLCGPAVDACTGLMTDAMDVITSSQVALPPRDSLTKHAWARQLAASDPSLAESMAQGSLKGTRSASHREALARQVGPSSEFERELHNKLNVILWKEFATALAAKVDANVAPVSAGIMARMSTRLVAGFCTSPTRVAQLISALQAPYEWRHPVAPIYSWLKSELARWVDLSFVWQELEAGLLPKLEDTLLEVETNVIMRYIIPKDKGITRDNVRAVLLDCFKFSHHVRRRFALAFNKRNSARSMYARLVHGPFSANGFALAKFASTARIKNLYEVLVATRDKSQRRDLCSNVAATLQRWFESRADDLALSITTLLIKPPGEGAGKTLLAKQWKDAKMRLHGAAYTPDQKSIKSCTRIADSLLIPAYRGFRYQFRDLLNSAAAEAASEALTDLCGPSSVADKYELQAKLLELPLQVLDSYPPYVAELLRAPMRRVRDLVYRSAVARALANKGGRGPPAPCGAPSAPPPGVCADWAVAGPSVSAADYGVFVDALRSSGFSLMPIPGRDNNCLYRSVLHELYGASAGTDDEAATDMAAALRAMVVDFLRHVTTEELAEGPTAYTWVASIQAVAGPAAAVTPAEAVVAEHLSRMEGGAQSTNVEVAALMPILDMDNNGAALVLYSPMYSAANSYCYTLTAMPTSDARRVVRIAWVPAGGAGELNHFVVVSPTPGHGMVTPPPAKKFKTV